MRDAAESSIDIGNGVALHVLESGSNSASPVLFVHGLTADAFAWRQRTQELAQHGFRAFAYSRRLNDPNRNAPHPEHTIAAEAADLLRLLDGIGLDSVRLIGHSFGGYVALWLAIQQPARVTSLTLAEPPLMPWLTLDAVNPPPTARAHDEIFKQRFLAPCRAALDAGDDDLLLRRFFDYFVAPDAIDQIPAAVVDRRRANLLELKAFVRSESPYPAIAPEDIARLSMPVLMMSGGRSKSTARHTDPLLEKSLPPENRKRVIFPRAGHNLWADAAADCLQAWLSWTRGGLQRQMESANR